MPERRKRKYTFRKDQLPPYESGSLIHEIVKEQRAIARNFDFGFEPRRTQKRR
jgi:hypothetical protein